MVGDVPKTSIWGDFRAVNGHSASTWWNKFEEAAEVYNVVISNVFWFMNYILLVGKTDKEREKLWKHNGDVSYKGVGCSLETYFGKYNVARFVDVFVAIKRMRDRIYDWYHPYMLRITNDMSDYPSRKDYTPAQMLKRWETCDFWGSTQTVKYLDSHKNVAYTQKVIYLCKSWSKFNIEQRWSNIMHEMTHAANVGPHMCSTDCKASGTACEGGWRCDGLQACLDLVKADNWAVIKTNSQTYTGWILAFFYAVMVRGKCWPHWVYSYPPKA